MKHPIEILERVRLGGLEQWVLLRAENADSPVLVHLQGGPGAPRIPEATGIERRLGLERHFLVVYWDPRGSGKSFDPRHPPELTLARLLEDTVELIGHVRNRTGQQRVILSGFSLGGSLAALVAARIPEQLLALVGVGLDIDYAESERHIYQFVLDEAQRTGNRRASRELAALGPPPHDGSAFAVRTRWLMTLGGVIRQTSYRAFVARILWEMLRSPYYRLGDIPRAARGMTFTQERLLPELSDFDLSARVPRLEIPFFLFQGRHDHAAPPELAERYLAKLDAPCGKKLVWFEASAHMPHYEEPEKFREEMLKVVRAAC